MVLNVKHEVTIELDCSLVYMRVRVPTPQQPMKLLGRPQHALRIWAEGVLLFAFFVVVHRKPSQSRAYTSARSMVHFGTYTPAESRLSVFPAIQNYVFFSRCGT